MQVQSGLVWAEFLVQLLSSVSWPSKDLAKEKQRVFFGWNEPPWLAHRLFLWVSVMIQKKGHSCLDGGKGISTAAPI